MVGPVTLLWTDGDRHVPCDYRIYGKAGDGRAKNDHFRDLPSAAAGRGSRPECVPFDSRYAALENLTHCRGLGWHWLTRLKENRTVNPGRAGPGCGRWANARSPGRGRPCGCPGTAS